jgi:hypothetical protein
MECYSPGDNHEALLVMADPQALAYAWIEAYALNISPDANDSDDDYEDDSPVTAEDLINHADSHQGEGWGDYICRGGTYEGFRIDPMFWDKYATVCGIPRESVQENSFFTCSC